MSDQGEWVLIDLDEKFARRHGVPKRLPVPKGDFEAIAEKGLSVESARKWVAAFLTQRQATPNAEIEALYKKLEAFLAKAKFWSDAQSAFEARDFGRAVSALRMIARIDPDDHAARMNLGSALAASGDRAGALATFDAIAETFADDVDFHVTRGQVALGAERRDDALEAFVRALEVNPSSLPALDALTKLGVLVKLYEDSRDARSLAYVRADSVVPALATAWDAAERTPSFFLEQAAYHAMEGRHEAALAAAERGLAREPAAEEQERLAMARVAALRDLGRAEEAIAAARAHRAAAPQSAWGCVELARCLAGSSPEEARACVREALQLDPGDVMALTLEFLPASLDDVAAVNAALPRLREFADQHAEVAGAHRVLGRAEIAAGLVDDGLEHLRRAAGLSTNDDVRAELWAELSRQRRYQAILDDAASIGDLGKRDGRLRWGEAEAWAGLGKALESRAAFTAINQDEALPVELRKRAKRAAESIRG